MFLFLPGRRFWARFFGCVFVLSVLLSGACPLAGQSKINGENYLSASQAAKRLGLGKVEWTQYAKTRKLSTSAVSVSFTRHSRVASLNGNPLALGSPVVLQGGELYINERDVLKTLQPILQPQQFLPAPGLRRIVIDAGHGGKDPGALNTALGLTEKILTLDVSRRLKTLLEQRGYQVVMTRNSDIALARTERTAIANRNRADLFVSVHFNTVGDKSVSGIETWVMTPAWQMSTGRTKYHASDRIVRENNRFDAWNALLGYYVTDSMSDQLSATKRGLKRARFDVLTGLNCPAILVECGFISNTTEGRKIATAAYRQQIAQSIADGIGRYQRTLNRISAPKR